MKKEVEAPKSASTTPPIPWFTIAVKVDVAFALSVFVFCGTSAALLTVGTPDLLDAVIAWVAR